MSPDSTRTATLGLGIGAVLFATGIISYAITDFAHVTALIPSIFGIIISAFGAVALRMPRYEREAIGGMGVFSLLGILGSLRGLPDIVDLVTGGNPDSAVGATSQGLFIALGIILLTAVAIHFFGD